MTPLGQIALHPIGQAYVGLQSGVGFDLVSGPGGKPWLIDGALAILNSKGKPRPRAILRIDPSGHFKTFPISLASFRLLGAGAYRARRTLYFSVTDANADVGPNPEPTIGALSSSGRVSFTALPKGLAPDFTFGGLYTPQPMTVGPDGDLWFISPATSSPAIVRFEIDHQLG